MLMLAFFLIAVLSVPLAGGQLSRLSGYRFAHAWAIVAALAVQIVIISLLPEQEWQPVAHLVSYALAVFFLWANRRIAGLWLAALGTGLNVVAITANGGVMPATRGALAAAGRLSESVQFANSAVLSQPNLGFLGDVFAIPRPLPLANVFSAGDVCIVLGAALILHQACRSRLVDRNAQQGTVRPVKPLSPVAQD